MLPLTGNQDYQWNSSYPKVDEQDGLRISGRLSISMKECPSTLVIDNLWKSVRTLPHSPLMNRMIEGNESFAVYESSGGMELKIGTLLKKKGYDIKIINLMQPEKEFGNFYNPIQHLSDDEDVDEAVAILSSRFQKAAIGAAKKSEFIRAEKELTAALLYYAKEEEPVPTMRSLRGITELLKTAKPKDNPSCTQTEDECASESFLGNIDEIFKKLDFSSNAMRRYREFAVEDGTVKKAALEIFYSHFMQICKEETLQITDSDDTELEMASRKKMAFFIDISPTHLFTNYIGSLFLEQLRRSAEKAHEQKEDGTGLTFLFPEYRDSGFDDTSSYVLSPGFLERARDSGCRVIANISGIATEDAEYNLNQFADRFDAIVFSSTNSQETRSLIARKIIESSGCGYDWLPELNEIKWNSLTTMQKNSQRCIVLIKGKAPYYETIASSAGYVDGATVLWLGIPFLANTIDGYRIENDSNRSCKAMLGIENRRKASAGPERFSGAGFIAMMRLMVERNNVSFRSSVPGLPSSSEFVSFIGRHREFTCGGTLSPGDKPVITILEIDGAAEDIETVEEFSETFYEADVFSMAGNRCHARYG